MAMESRTHADAAAGRLISRNYPAVPAGCLLQKRWLNDYRMQSHCRDQQEDARLWSRGRVHDADISQMCTARWSRDWHMFRHCVLEQERHKGRL